MEADARLSEMTYLVREDEVARRKSASNRQNSWIYCHQAFAAAFNKSDHSVDERDSLALHLAFYLASWGMLRGSSPLLQCSYKVHLGAIDTLLEPQYRPLRDISAETLCHEENLDLLMKLKKALVKHYKGALSSYAKGKSKYSPSDTLITKILLGTLACVPAYDQYFVEALGRFGLNPKQFSRTSIKAIAGFCQANTSILTQWRNACKEQYFPDMKLLDLAFWLYGEQLDNTAKSESSSRSAHSQKQ